MEGMDLPDNPPTELTYNEKRVRVILFLISLSLLLLWDTTAILLQFLLLRWFWMPLMFIGLSVAVVAVSAVLFSCIFRYSLMPFALLRLGMLSVIVILWALNILRWYNHDRSPGWAGGLDTIWTDTQALGFSYAVLFGWLAIAAVLLFLVLLIYYLPQMRLLRCCMGSYTSLSASPEIHDQEEELDTLELPPDEEDEWDSEIKLTDDEIELP